ncbi:unnamed protein product [Leptidea sinapis]|uniref:SH3 domain-containing protein n=1 Tax=Leptidea sinapis TaxID=189913 RepID=A0A5E4Q4Y1_9NEOP|nr:unnamed protein product [Leptidea sinapis]
MRVCRKPIDTVPHYFLSESRFFRSVVELVTLNSTLKWPFRRVVATVIHDFRPLEATQLALRPGSKVLVLSKEGDSRGWWKGRILDKIACTRSLSVSARLTDATCASPSARDTSSTATLWATSCEHARAYVHDYASRIPVAFITV